MRKSEFRKILRVKRRFEDYLLNLPNVVGVGLGIKRKGGEYLPEPAIVVFVKKKLPEEQLDVTQVVPHEIEGVKTDVVESGEFRAIIEHPLAPSDPDKTSRVRPARPGVSIGHYKITAGTFGFLVKDRKDGELVILSNNHVLAFCNAGSPGDPILQPGTYDGGTTDDKIAELKRFVLIHSTGNHIDAAIASPVAEVAPEIWGVNKIQGAPKEVGVGDTIAKSGRTTCYNQNVVESINATVDVHYGCGNIITARFEDQIIVRNPFGQPGDSGSGVFDPNTMHSVGLLFAGSATHTVVNPARYVEKELDVKFDISGGGGGPGEETPEWLRDGVLSLAAVGIVGILGDRLGGRKPHKK